MSSKTEELKAADRLALNFRKAEEKNWIPKDLLDKAKERRSKNAREGEGEMD